MKFYTGLQQSESNEVGISLHKMVNLEFPVFIIAHYLNRKHCPGKQKNAVVYKITVLLILVAVFLLYIVCRL